MATKTGEEVQVQGMLYRSVLKSVLLYESKIWVLIGAMIKLLEGFHNRVARIITWMTAWRTTSGE